MPDRNFSISHREVQDIIVLELRGRLTYGEPVATFREQVHAEIAAGRKKLAINMEGVSYTDSSGVGAMVGALTIAESSGAECKFFAVPPQLQNVLKQISLDDVLSLEANEAAVLAAWKTI